MRRSNRPIPCVEASNSIDKKLQQNVRILERTCTIGKFGRRVQHCPDVHPRRRRNAQLGQVVARYNGELDYIDRGCITFGFKRERHIVNQTEVRMSAGFVGTRCLIEKREPRRCLSARGCGFRRRLATFVSFTGFSPTFGWHTMDRCQLGLPECLRRYGEPKCRCNRLIFYGTLSCS